jgi:DNA polymerase (family 10)
VWWKLFQMRGIGLRGSRCNIVNPDAHAIQGFEDCRYGVLVAQKAGVTKDNNLSSYTLDAFEKWVATQQTKRK